MLARGASFRLGCSCVPRGSRIALTFALLMVVFLVL
ncbi:MAG: hypothetical protein HN403_08165 [Rhodospirillales bacterium]|nr:hypothetical protein [Rhodospirillales bacterium]